MKFRTFFATILYLFAFMVPMYTPLSVSAASVKGDIYEQVNAGAKAAEMGAPADPRVVIARMIQIMLSLVGMLFMILIVVAGFRRMKANGDEGKIEESTNTITNAIIGIVIVFMAYIITTFVLTRIQNAVSTETIYEVDDKVPNTQYNIPVIDVNPKDGFCLFGKCF